jgi:hypothetical protein
MPETVGETSAAVAPTSEERTRLEKLSSKEAYDAFLPAARAVAVSVLQECKADAVLVHDAVTRGVEAVLSHEPELAQLPDVNVEELRSLPWLVQGLAFAILQQQRSWSAAGRDSANGALPSLAEATELRDRYWTLLLQRHEALWRCGAWIYGQEVDSHVAPLQPRRGWEAAVAQSQGASRSFELDSSPAQPRRRERFVIRIGPDLSRL